MKKTLLAGALVLPLLALGTHFAFQRPPQAEQGLRSGTFEPLRFVPKGKVVVLGLVSTKRAALERKEDLLKRVDEAAKWVGLEQLALSPQCGFASTMEGNLLTEDQQWAKLKLVVDTAREVWG